MVLTLYHRFFFFSEDLDVLLPLLPDCWSGDFPPSWTREFQESTDRFKSRDFSEHLSVINKMTDTVLGALLRWLLSDKSDHYCGTLVMARPFCFGGGGTLTEIIITKTNGSLK